MIQERTPMPKQYDTWDSVINGIPIATHFYYMHQQYYGIGNRAPFSQSGQVLNLLYMPFLKPDDVVLNEIPYDTDYYGEISNQMTGDPIKDIKVYKITSSLVNNKLIGSFKPKYKIQPKEVRKSWKNESKLYQYPYSYITINDYINTPLKLQYHLIPTTDKIEIKVSQPLSITGGYNIFVDGYKGDKNNGANEGMLASAGLDLPTSSSQYAQFMATSKASFIAQNEISQRNETLGLRLSSQQMGGTIAQSMLNPTDWLGILGTTAGALNQSSMTDQQVKNERQNYITQAQAQIQDLMRAPRSVNLSSSDILMSLSRNNKKLVANRYTIQDYYKNKLCDYFTLYGYKQNKMMKPNLKSRKYFNYIKTFDANIYGENISKNELDEIKNIFNTGITFWHRFAVKQDLITPDTPTGMYNYSLDNVEV